MELLGFADIFAGMAAMVNREKYLLGNLVHRVIPSFPAGAEFHEFRVGEPEHRLPGKQPQVDDVIFQPVFQISDPGCSPFLVEGNPDFFTGPFIAQA